MDRDEKVIALQERIYALVKDCDDTEIAAAALTAALGRVIKFAWVPPRRDDAIDHYARTIHDYCAESTH